MDEPKTLKDGYVMFSRFTEENWYDPPGTKHISDDEYRRRLRERFPDAPDSAIEFQVSGRKRHS